MEYTRDDKLGSMSPYPCQIVRGAEILEEIKMNWVIAYFKTEAQADGGDGINPQ